MKMRDVYYELNVADQTYQKPTQLLTASIVRKNLY